MKNRFQFVLVLLGAFTLFFVFSIGPTAPTGRATSPTDIVQQAWQQAGQADRYQFRTRLEQTLYPAKTLANAGKYAATDRVNIEGETNRAAESLLLRLRRPEDAADQATEIRVADGQTSARIAGGEWQPLKEQSDTLFGPGQDPLNYLAAVKNVQSAERSDPADLSLLLAAEHFTFEIDGPAYAALMRDELQAHLLAQGELPPGVTIAVADQYRDMTAEGELWLDDAGLPLRLKLNIVFPPEADGSQTAANLQTDFFDFVVVDHSQLTLPARAQRALSRFDWQALGANAALLLSGILLMTGSYFGRRWRTRLFYNTTVSVVVLSMVATPLLQSVQAAGFFERQTTRQAETKTQRAEQLAQMETAAPPPVWDSTVDPLSRPARGLPPANLTGTDSAEPLFASALFSTSNCSDADNADSDNDGLLDMLEARYGSNCEVADTDSDGLSDALEVLQLGTDPTLADSDSDGLTDPVEVAGGDQLGGYSDPLNMDTNYDGLPDGMECQLQTGANCRDTDGDGYPDIFDDDNDGDGVLDSDDISPYGALGSSDSPFTADTPFAMQVDGIEADYPLFVDFQLRTVITQHLTYPYNVLDWPSGDTVGQVQRIKDTTFENTQAPEARISGARGDMQLVPLLEITIPDAHENYGHLPTLPNPGSLTPSSPITGWLDVAQLTPYGISVNQINPDRTDLAVYVPLTAETGVSGGEQVALTGRMLYRSPAGVTAWGQAHQVRLLWLVRMLVDVCDNPDEDDDYCQDPTHRQDKLTVVHSYYDDWYLTGLKVREDHGLNVALAFEDPATDTNLTYDQNLWQLSNGLNRVFMGGRATGDTRDLTISTIKQRFDRDSNGGVSDAERWGIPQNALRVETFSYPHEGYIMHIAMTETVRLLETHFGAHQETKPTILLAQEEQVRLFNLDAQDTLNGSRSFQASLTDATLDTFTGLIWTPFVYDDTTKAWATEPLADYETHFKTSLAAVPFFAPGDTADSKLIAAGRQHIAWRYYQTMAVGSYNLVQSDQTVFTEPTADVSDAKLADGFQTGDGVALKVSRIGERMRELAHLSAVDPNQDVYRLLGIWLAGGDPGWVDWTAVARRALSNWEDTPVDALITIKGVAVTAQLAARVVSVVKTTFKLLRIAFAAAGITGSVSGILSFGKWSVIFFVVTLIVIWGAFTYQVWNEPGDSAAIGHAAASAYAQTIVAVFLFSMALIGFGWLVLIIAIIDILLIISCWLGWTDTLCSGISGWVTKKLTNLMYDLDPHVDLNDDNRLQISNFEVNFARETQGFQAGNNIEYLISLTNTLKYDGNTSTNLTNPSFPGLSDAKNSTFAYRLQTNKSNIHGNLHAGDMTDEWTESQTSTATKVTSLIHMTATTSLHNVTFPQAGINQKKPNPLYLTEGFAVPATEHWDIWVFYPPAFFRIPYSRDVTYYDSHHVNLADLTVYDIFPSTLSKFHQLHSVGNGQYALNWGNNDTLSFPAIWDADGDGLGNRHAGGADPDDSRWDSDGDGLSDAFELDNGLSPTNRDSDADGLDDRREFATGTPPRLADTDGDGLTDAQELTGWSVVYSDTLTTWVWSDPFVYDTDGDGLNDFKEQLFGFNPRTPSDPRVLDYELQLERRDGRTELGTIVGNGDSLDYTARIHSRLNSRNAEGLLSMNQAPAPLVVQSQPQNFFLSPSASQTATLTGTVTINAPALTPSGVYTLSQTAGATIKEPQADSYYAQVFLPFNGPGDGATPPDLTDFSEQAIKHNGRIVGSGNCYSMLRTDQPQVPIYPGYYYGKVGVRCDGNDDAHVQLARSLSRPLYKDYTVAMWLYRELNQSNAGWSIFNASNYYENLDLNCYSTTCTFNHLSLASNMDLVSGNVSWPVPKGMWTHVAVTRQGEMLSVYSDGELKQSVALDAGIRFLRPLDVILGSNEDVTIDDFYFFPRAINQNEVEALSRRINQVIINPSNGQTEILNLTPSLHLPLDEAQGKTQFKNPRNLDAATLRLGGDCAAVGCPTTGLPGLINQAALFNGHNRISWPYVSNSANTAMSVWVNWDGTPGEQTILYNGNQCSPRYGSIGGGIGLKDGRVQLLANSGWQTVVEPSPAITLTPHRWHHLTLVNVSWGATINNWVFFIDGREHNPMAVNSVNVPTDCSPGPAKGEFIGGDPVAGHGFTGLLDDVRFYDVWENIYQADVYHAAPTWQLHLDESPGVTAFADTRANMNGQCSGAACPVSGHAGQVFGAARFDGGDSIATVDNLNIGTTDLTMMAWVKWDGTDRHATILYNGDTGQNGYGLVLGDNGLVRILNGGVDWADSSYNLHPNEWEHLTITRDADTWRLYVNGSGQDLTKNPTPRTPDNSSVQVGSGFHGFIDEPAIYQRALSGSEIYEHFLAQGRWIQEEHQFGITLDVAPPNVELTSYNPAGFNYRKNEPVLLSVTAVDDYAGVESVTVTADGNPLTAEKDVASEHTWYAWFPAPGGGNPGEGAHTLSVQATDRLDNVGPAVGPYTLYVDGTPPNISITDPGTLLGVSNPPGRPAARQVRLTGTVSDPPISGTATPGSGPAAVYVSLYQPTGNLAGDSWQTAGVTGSTWTLDYVFNHLNVTGAYTVTAAAVDQLGNRATAVPLVIHIENQPPTATLQTSTLPTATIVSGSLTLTGTAVERPLTYTVAGLSAVDLAFTPLADGSAAFNDVPLRGLTAHWPLDDSPALTGTLTIRDISGNGHHGECDTCPALGQSGHIRSMAKFDGINDAVTLPAADQLSLTNHDFTVSAWVKLTDTSGDRVVLGTNTQATNQGLRLMVSDGTPVLGFYGNDLTGGQTLQPGQWYHLVWRYTKSTNEQAIFINGALDTSEAGHAPFTGAGPVYLGRAWAGTAFNGLLDEVQLYNRPLSADEIAGLYRGSGPLLWLKLDDPAAVDGAAVRDDSGWEHHGQLGSSDRAEKAVPGAVGPFALSFDGVDDTVLLPTAVSNLTPPQFSAAFWVKLDGTFAADTIIAKGNVAGDIWFFRTTNAGAGQGQGVSFNLGASSPLLWQWGDAGWHHVAGVYNGSQQILYVDGVETGRGTVSGFSDTAFALLSLGVNQSQPTAAMDGQLDDVRYYPRAITPGEVRDLAGSNWRAATLSAAGSGVRTADWSYALPAGLEGLYRLDLQPADRLGNRGLQDGNQWAGLIDTLAPRVDLTSAYATAPKYQCYPLGPFSWSGTRCTWVNETDYNTFNYSYRAEDFNLSTLSPSCDNPASTHTYYQSPWYREMAGNNNRLYQISGSCKNSQTTPANFQVTACDAAGNCATATAPAVAAAPPISIQAPDPLYTEIVSPTAASVITHSHPVSLTAWGVALNYLQAMTVSIDSVPAYSATWTQGEAITATGLLTSHLLAEGTHPIESVVSDWAGGIISHTITVTVDTLPPQLALNPAPLTRTHYHPGGLLDVSGLVTDSNAITAVQVRLSPDGAWSSPAHLNGNRWIAPLVLPGNAPDGVNYTLNARATDIAGRETVVTGTVWVDVVAPPPVALTLRADGLEVAPGETVRAASPTLSLSWPDNSFAADALWHPRASHQDWLTATVTGQPAGGATSAAFSPGEAMQVEATLIRRDALGNQRSQRWGVLTVDASTTPDFVNLTPAGGYSQKEQDWLASGCTLLGVDRRSDRQVSELHARDGEQRLYASWDSAGLRLAWQGANWAGDGDLFVYLDTQTGGATQAYNPFADGHTVHLPGDFAADTLVWVQNETDAALLHWDGASWASTPLTADRYHFEGDQTDLYLPFADLGLTDPAATPLKLLAFATEPDVLELWAALPPANPLNSPLVSDHAPFVNDPDTFGLSRAYAWAGLGAGVCPNAAYPDIDLTFNLTADPTGTEYAFLGDNLHFLWDELMVSKTTGITSLFAHTDANHPPLADGQAISYTLTYHNRGTITATAVAVEVTAANGLQLSGGNRTIALGNVGPEQAGSVDFAGQVVSGGTQDWANLEALVYTAAHPAGGPPLEWLWVDHPIDHTAPVSLTIRQPVSVVGPGVNIFSGSVYDASPPVSLTLGSTPCPPAQADGRWRCEWDANGAADGEIFLLSLHATDAFGQGTSSAGTSFVVDSTPPDITVSTATLRLSNSFHSLSGQVSDNHGLGAVSVCWALGECGPAALADDGYWAYALPLPAGLDGVTHTVTISATDAVGNQSQTQTEVWVDTVPPVFSANQLLTEGVWLTDTLTVLAGAVSDGSGPIEQINVLVKSPDGSYVTLGADPEAGAWAFNLRPELGGVYTLWATAQDAAGNRSVRGPYLVEAVVEPTFSKLSSPGDIAAPGSNIDYLLEIRNTSAVTVENITITDPLPVGVTPTAVSGGTACLRAATGAIEWQPFNLGPNSVTYLGVTTMLTGTGVYSGAVISNTAVMTTTLWGAAASNTDYVMVLDSTTGNNQIYYLPIIFKNGTNPESTAGSTPVPPQAETTAVPPIGTSGLYKLYLPLLFTSEQPGLPLCQ